MRSIYIVLSLVSLAVYINSQDPADIVTDLPDYPYKGRLYSGYLDLDDPLKKYHYLFVEAAQDSYNAPLVLWLNGGPGCSSMLGWITENGPAIFPGSEPKLKINEYSWHKLANFIYLESPGNVGFSYIDSYMPTETYIDDVVAAKENLQALLSFFKKFPSFKKNDFYIAGESYAGVYIPRLAEQIVDYNAKVMTSQKINFKGFTIGNALTSWKYDITNALIDFAFTHSLYSYEMRKEYLEVCINKPDKDKCTAIVSKINKLLDGLNIYDLLQDCGTRTDNTNIDNNSFYYKYAKWAFPKQTTPNKNFLGYLFDEEPLTTAPPCIENDAPLKYFNRADVKAALHVKSSITWDMCNDLVNKNYVMSEEASYYLYPKLIKSGLKIMIFSGDTDMAVPYNGSQRWIDSLKLEILSPWRSWRAFGDMTTIAGYRTIYKGLTFVTVKGTGHMVPQWKPKEAFYMFKQFLNGEDL